MPQPEDILKRYWGYSNFRPLQKDIITSILSGKDTVALMPTGGGKSICYQVPALMLDGLTIVVTPLIALMQEQVEKLKSLDIPCAHISAGMHRSDVYRLLNNAAEGAYKLFYISPERIQTDLFNEFLPALPIDLVAVDEAHCVSQWGHDFRPDYLKINVLRQVFKQAPILAVTASATPEVQQDIITQLQLKHPQVFKQSFERTNIHYNITYSEQKTNELVDALQQHPGSAIVYCRSRKQTEVLSRQLQTNGIDALPYHAGMSNDLRLENRQLWASNKAAVMVATTAFGMGIDKPDVRLVAHYDVPEHIEAFYQESGRAGRDGKPAQSLLLYNQQDINKLENSTDIQFPPFEFIRQVYQSVAEYLHIPIGAEPYRYFDFHLTEFCQRFGLPVVTTIRALKLLEQEGLWTLTESVFNPATVQVIADREELDNIGSAYPDLHLLIITMLRLYGTLYYHPTAINIKMIAKHLQVKPSLISQMLMHLDKMELLNFNQPKDGPQLFFHHYRVDSKTLIMNTARINALKKAHEERTTAMVNFVTNSKQCKTRILLHYFGQESDANCGHCDFCISSGISNTSPEHARKDILQLLSVKQPVSAPELARLLPQYNGKELVAIARQMIDDGILTLSNNAISIK